MDVEKFFVIPFRFRMGKGIQTQIRLLCGGVEHIIAMQQTVME